jgi:uncharacterized protein YbjT (DUF2867 family)
VGRHLVGALMREGYSAVVPTRSARRAEALRVLPGTELRETDINDPRSMRYALDGCETVVNLVGIINERGHTGLGFKRAHVDLVDNLIRVSKTLGVRRIVHISALKANAERGPSHYLRTKGQAEQLLRNRGGSEIAFTLFRPSVIFGPDDSFINRFTTLLRYLPVLPLARPSAMFAPVYVGDVVEAILIALRDADTYGRTYELCGPHSFTLHDIVRLIAQQANSRCLILKLPDLLARIQAAICDYAVPGKPFSLDNFRSLTVASTCSGDGLKSLGVDAKAFETLLPTCIGKARHRDRLTTFRQSASR